MMLSLRNQCVALSQEPLKVAGKNYSPAGSAAYLSPCRHGDEQLNRSQFATEKSLLRCIFCNHTAAQVDFFFLSSLSWARQAAASAGVACDCAA